MHRRQFLGNGHRRDGGGRGRRCASAARSARDAGRRATATLRCGRLPRRPPLREARRSGDIAYVERGRGEAALFLHGFPLNGFQWRGALRAPVAVPPLHRAGLPRPGLHRGRAGPERGARRAGRDAGRAARPAAASTASTWSPTTAAAQAAQLFLARYPQRVRTLLLTNCDSRDRMPAAGAAAGASNWRGRASSSSSGWRRGWPTRRWRVRRRASAA